ncbi:MAG: ral L-amino acid transport system permease protein [Hyphomicrobiales bacterium]|nr:ral L-amino acid transport system permease protein [Hyphomicrobiales bacterium]
MSIAEQSGPPKVSPIYDPKVRSIAYQVILCGVILFLAYSAVRNAADNLARAKIASGFGFWNQTAGFDISQTLIEYSANSGTYGRAFWVGLLNTLLVAAIGIVLATIVGFLVGIARLSRNWLMAKVSAGYVELIRNVPLLLQLLFWYNAVLKALPDLRDSWSLPGSIYLNNRGFFSPAPVFQSGMEFVLGAFIVGVIGAFAFRIWARRRQEATGQQAPVLLVMFGLIVGLPVIAFFIAGMPATLEFPEKGRFNIRGGLEILPELVALLIGLTLYTGAFIAEVVRAGILAVSRGQTEAAGALGLRTGPTLQLVVIPQAMRVIIPPLTNQYLNLTKNSSLAVFVGYPDLVQIFTGTVLNQTGQAVEVVMITMAVYLSISLVTSMVMNWYNSRIALVER